MKRRRQNTQGRCKKRRREEQGYSSAANLDSQHPHQDRGLASKNDSHLYPVRPARDGQMTSTVTSVVIIGRKNLSLGNVHKYLYCNTKLVSTSLSIG